MEGTGFPLEL
ncbi:Protein of unknown function [Bacillus mycoides]|nr:Protein of unknown function [Bacillus mycoides]